MEMRILRREWPGLCGRTYKDASCFISKILAEVNRLAAAIEPLQVREPRSVIWKRHEDSNLKLWVGCLAFFRYSRILSSATRLKAPFLSLWILLSSHRPATRLKAPESTRVMGSLVGHGHGPADPICTRLYLYWASLRAGFITLTSVDAFSGIPV